MCSFKITNKITNNQLQWIPVNSLMALNIKHKSFLKMRIISVTIATINGIKDDNVYRLCIHVISEKTYDRYQIKETKL